MSGGFVIVRNCEPCLLMCVAENLRLAQAVVTVCFSQWTSRVAVCSSSLCSSSLRHERRYLALINGKPGASCIRSHAQNFTSGGTRVELFLYKSFVKWLGSQFERG
jgi:hypothetical protein